MAKLTLDAGSVVETGELWTIAVNRNQNLLGKLILVLNRNCTDVRELEPPEWDQLMVDMRRVTAALDAMFQPDLFNYAFLMNMDRHVHLHVLPRYAGPRTWHGAVFRDTRWGEASGDDVRRLPEDELTKLAVAIRAHLPD